MPYTAARPQPRPNPEELRARIPGWGVDLDPAVRPAVPREQYISPESAGAHWDVPTRQEAGEGREKSIEHARLTPVFGTTVPMTGVSGAVRRYAYGRFSEGQTAHWLLLMAADRIDVVESAAQGALATYREKSGGHSDGPAE